MSKIMGVKRVVQSGLRVRKEGDGEGYWIWHLRDQNVERCKRSQLHKRKRRIQRKENQERIRRIKSHTQENNDRSSNSIYLTSKVRILLGQSFFLYSPIPHHER